MCTTWVCPGASSLSSVRSRMDAAAISMMVVGRTSRMDDVITSRMDNGLVSRMAVAAISKMYENVNSIAVDATVVSGLFMLVKRLSRSGGSSTEQGIAWTEVSDAWKDGDPLLAGDET